MLYVLYTVYGLLIHIREANFQGSFKATFSDKPLVVFSNKAGGVTWKFQVKKLKDLVFFWLPGFFREKRHKDQVWHWFRIVFISFFCFQMLVQFMFGKISKNAQRILTDVLGVWTVVFMTDEHETEIANKIKRLNLQGPFMDDKGVLTNYNNYTLEN